MFRNNTSSQVHQCLQNVVFISRSLTSWEKGLGSKIFSPTEAIWSMLKLLQIPELQPCLPQRILGIWRWCIWMVLKLRNPIFECVVPTSFKQPLKLGNSREMFHHLNTHLFFLIEVVPMGTISDLSICLWIHQSGSILMPFDQGSH